MKKKTILTVIALMAVFALTLSACGGGDESTTASGGAEGQTPDQSERCTEDLAGGTITVTLTRGGRDAVLDISDTGVGIQQEDLPHVFDRFYRVDKARSRDTGGTGLGLSIVQQIVRLHAGSVTVQSEQGKGTTFTVQLPVK